MASPAARSRKTINKRREASESPGRRRLHSVPEDEVSDPEGTSPWEKLGAEASATDEEQDDYMAMQIAEMLQAEEMTEHEKDLFLAGQLRLGPASARWRSMFLKLMGSVTATENMRSVSGMAPHLLQRGEERMRTPLTRRCDTRIAYHKKTPEEKLEAAKKKLAKAKAAQTRREVKQIAAKELEEYAQALEGTGETDPWTPQPTQVKKRLDPVSEQLWLHEGQGREIVGVEAGVPAVKEMAVPMALCVNAAEGYVPAKHPLPAKAQSVPAKAPPGTRPMTTAEMMRALADMTVVIEQQRVQNERVHQRVSEVMRQPRQGLSDEEMMRIAMMMSQMQQQASSAPSSPGASGSQEPA
ncbi:unnamed protein product [Prorocentrum cordatum]|uniref:Ribosome biogenesis protein NOP53 n=1 Tax=Prorocentrum cordatum TaxID=2364126 RepID=A0ABN9WYA7_9DINO|nr:unnamed protein product [Polarella glacialis]